MPPSTARASAPTVVVSLLTEIHLNPPLTFLNYPHRIASSDLLPLSPTSFTSPLNLTLRRTNRESRMQNPLLPRVRRASGFVQIFLSQVPRRDTLGSTRKLTTGALVEETKICQQLSLALPNFRKSLAVDLEEKIRDSPNSATVT